jgi:hypothetical protein
MNDDGDPRGPDRRASSSETYPGAPAHGQGEGQHVLLAGRDRGEVPLPQPVHRAPPALGREIRAHRPDAVAHRPRIIGQASVPAHDCRPVVSCLRVSCLRVSCLRVSCLRVSCLRVSCLRVSCLRDERREHAGGQDPPGAGQELPSSHERRMNRSPDRTSRVDPRTGRSPPAWSAADHLLEHGLDRLRLYCPGRDFLGRIAWLVARCAGLLHLGLP